MYAELLGNGLVGSLNYDRRVAGRAVARVGVFALAAADGEGGAAVAAVPITVGYLSGGGSHHFEAAVGALLASGEVSGVEGYEDESFGGVMGTGTLGYRYQRPTGGLLFRAGLTPFFGAGGVVPWLGVSPGYAW